MTTKITRNVASTATKAPVANGKAASKAPKAPVASKATKAVKAAPVAAPVQDSALEIRINALASMIRGLNDTCESLVTENAALRAEVSALVEKLNAAPVAEAPVAIAADNKVFSALAPKDNAFETAAAEAIANYHAGYVNEKVLDAATRMGKGITARCYLRTNENRAFKAYLKACGLSLAEADAALDAMVFDA